MLSKLSRKRWGRGVGGERKSDNTSPPPLLRGFAYV
jgi:hypothetical protein